MTKAFDTQPVYKGGLSEKSFTETHIFTCDSPVVRNWGLCSFTKTDLDFLSYHDTFQKIINGGATGKPQRLKVLSSIMDTNKDEYLNITVWRDRGRNGEYKKYEKLSEWEFEDTKGLIGAEGAVYKADKLELNEFEIEPPEDQTVNVPDPEEPKAPNEPPEDATEEELEEYRRKQEQYEELFEEYQVKLAEASLERKEATQAIDREISKSLYSKMFAGKLMRLNDYINSLKIEEWEDWELKDKVRFEFLVDIRSSKERAVNWTSTITYYEASTKSVDKPPQDTADSAGFIFGRKNKKGEVVDKNDPPPTTSGGGETDPTDPVDPVTEPDPETAIETITVYETELQTECSNKLYLYSLLDGEVDDSRSVCLKNLKFASSKSLYDFGSFLRREDGKLFEHLVNANPNNQVAAPLDLQYNEYLGKWESGSPQMIAVISQDIPAAQGPDIDSIEKNPIDTLLDPLEGQETTYGYAIPYHMQNANPRQWSAIYDVVEERREDDYYDKSKIKVHNIFPKPFARGEIVILNRIEGLWFPTLSLGGDPVPKTLEPADPRWEFMYLMTSADFHFRNKNFERITPSIYERGFYRRYYEAYANSEGSVEGIINLDKNKNRYKEAYGPSGECYNEYFQISSFDFLNTAVGGLRDDDVIEMDDERHAPTQAHAISNTILGENLDKTSYGDEEKLKTYPFFGCVFPEGHSAGSIIDKMAELHSPISPDYGSVKHYHVEYSEAGRIEKPIMTDIAYGAGDNFRVNNAVKSLLAGTSDAQTLGLFSNLADGDLKHVPADILTNSSPNGRWGRPIDWVGHFDPQSWTKDGNDYTGCNSFLSKTPGPDNNLVPVRGSYLYNKTINSDDTETDNYDTSWYDIQPLNHYNLQFRPLSRELYASYEAYEPDNQRYWWDYDDFSNDNLGTETPAGIIYKRGNLSYRMYSVIEGFVGPLSKTSFHRNQFHLKTGLNDPSTLLHPKYGLKYSSDLVYDKQFGSDNRNTNLPKGVDGTDEGYPFKWWDDKWMTKNGVTRPAGGVGIIGAACTVRSQDNISLTTDNNIGVGDFLVVTNPLEYSASMKNGNYDDQLTTALYARVYQHHPRHLTWYDPRFMVVHHFNAGDGRVGETRITVEYKAEQDDPETIHADGLDKFKTLNNPRFQNYHTHQSGVVYLDEHPTILDLPNNYDRSASGYFLVDVAEYGIDFRVPTDWNGNNNIQKGKKIFLDSTTDISKTAVSASDVSFKLRDAEHWNVQTHRRSKLLPYSFRFKTIGIGVGAEKVLMEKPGSGKVDISTYHTAVINRGSGYKQGDKFEVIGGNGFGTTFTVMEVGNYTDGEGNTIENGILAIGIESDEDSGMAYNFDNFIQYAVKDSNDNWVKNDPLWDDDNIPSSSLSLQPLASANVTGTGFEAYVFSGEVTLTPEMIDPKPLEALDVTGPIRLTPNIPRNNTNVLQGQIIQPQSTNYQIINRHNDDKYDIFFRYHNDITHVAMDDTDIPFASEQQVAVSIGVTLGQSASTLTTADQLAGMIGSELGGGNNAVDNLLGNMNDGFHTSDGDQAADQAGSYMSFGDGVGGNFSFR